MAKLSTDQLIDAFKELTLIELSEFVSQFEEVFNVTAAAPVAVAAKPVAAANEVPSLEVINALLAKNTCTACHNATKRQVGPAYVEIAKRKYSNEKIVELIYNPKPENWPDYATPMAAMPH